MTGDLSSAEVEREEERQPVSPPHDNKTASARITIRIGAVVLVIEAMNDGGLYDAGCSGCKKTAESPSRDSRRCQVTIAPPAEHGSKRKFGGDLPVKCI